MPPRFRATRQRRRRMFRSVIGGPSTKAHRVWPDKTQSTSVDDYPDDMEVRSFGRSIVCAHCGRIGADARPNWREQTARPSLRLPLLEYALKETWAQREGHALTASSYARSGGVREA